MEKFIPVTAVQDNDSHWYVVPNDKVSQFASMLRDAEETDEYEGFEDTFGEYRTGGDLNLAKLYIRAEG